MIKTQELSSLLNLWPEKKKTGHEEAWTMRKYWLLLL